MGDDITLRLNDSGDDTVVKLNEGGKNAIDVEDNDSAVGSFTVLDFHGGSVTDSGDGSVKIDVSGGSKPSVSDDGTKILATPDDLNFSNGLSVTDDGDDTVTIDASGAALDTQDDGTSVEADTTTLDFQTDFSVSNPNSGEAEITLDSNSLTVAGNSVSLGGSTSVATTDLSDQNISTPSAGETILYDGTNSEFVNATITAGTALGSSTSDGSFTLNVQESNISHDNLSGFVSNEHIDHSNVSISSGTALSGGGDITSSRTLNVSGPLTNIDFKTSGDVLQWQTDGNNDLTLQNTTDASTILTIDQDTGDILSSNVVPNAALDNSSVTVTAGDGLKNGGSVSLGSSTTIDVEPADFAGSGLQDDGSDNLALTNNSVTVAGNTVSLGNSTSVSIDDLSDVASSTESAGQLPIWHGTNSQYENAALTGGNAIGVTNADASITLDVSSGAIQTDELDLSISPTWTGNHTFNDYQTWQEITTPSGSPSTGYWRIYMKSDGNLYVQEDDGTEAQIGGTTDTRTDISDSGTTVVSDTQDINVTTSNDASASVTDDGDGTATLDISTTVPVDSVAGKTGAVTLGTADLTDQALPNATSAGQLLIWNGTNSQFENAAITAGSGISKTEGDASLTVSLTNDTVTVAGNSVSLGSSTAVAAGDLSNVNLSTPAAGQFLIYDGTNSEFDNASITAGSGLTSTSGDASFTLDVSTGNGLEISSDSVRVNPAGFAGNGLKETSSTTLGVEPADFAGTFVSDDGSDNITVDIGDGLENDGSGNIKSEEPFVHDGGAIEIADGESNSEINRIALQTGETLVVDRIECRLVGGGSSTSVSARVQDLTAASTIGSQTAGGTTKNPGSSGTANTVAIQVSNSSGSLQDVVVRVNGRIQGA